MSAAPAGAACAAAAKNNTIASINRGTIGSLRGLTHSHWSSATAEAFKARVQAHGTIGP
jgi:hypothetical protein